MTLTPLIIGSASRPCPHRSSKHDLCMPLRMTAWRLAHHDFHITPKPVQALDHLCFANATELAAQKVRLHLSEVKGPVMDRLKTTHFLRDLNGKAFLSQYDVWIYLSQSKAGTNMI